ncbi:uncharacterized protein LOC136041286 [Artemia franciscana]|uniref:tRNA-splicing endonuclease subunit Sen2 n=1 Tax=Artemia franciscana TaxID=6661 RepID=A0AA88KS44_ARTSF|nr:hypothetical protein QYM36_017638 [Artemia franciscana]KAK2704068.1 hypothetical protein QYM36_017638 [Artemia franciscana]KAK2704069.1 hypothetical protein QYM36_017638 [Artemia franciscana]
MSDILPPPKEKASNKWTKLHPQLPILEETQTGAKYCFVKLSAVYHGGRVIIEDQDNIDTLFYKGYFGKGTLSRGEPSYDKTKEAYTSSRYEFKEVTDLNPYNPIPDNGKEGEAYGDLNIDRIISKNTSILSALVTSSDKIKESSNSYEDTQHVDFDQGETFFDDNAPKVTETLELMPEEAFFLKYSFNCLDVYDHNENLSIKCLWDLFSEQDPRFPLRYVAYHYYRSKGWVVKSGLIFGGDFALYKDGPPHYHSTYIILVKDADDQGLSWIELSAHVRVSETIAKALIICEIVRKEDRNLSLSELRDCQVRELFIKRWMPSKHNSEDSGHEDAVR